MGGEAELFQNCIDLIIVIARIQAHPCGRSVVGLGRSTTTLSRVGRVSFMSCRLAPSTTRPIGTHVPPSANCALRRTRRQPVGLGPVFSHPRALPSVPHPSLTSPTRCCSPQTGGLREQCLGPKVRRRCPGRQPQTRQESWVPDRAQRSFLHTSLVGTEGRMRPRNSARLGSAPDGPSLQAAAMAAAMLPAMAS